EAQAVARPRGRPPVGGGLPRPTPPRTLTISATEGSDENAVTKSISCTHSRTVDPAAFDIYRCSLTGWKADGDQDATLEKGFAGSLGQKIFQAFAIAQNFETIPGPGGRIPFGSSLAVSSEAPEWESVSCSRDSDGFGILEGEVGPAGVPGFGIA